MHVSKSKTQGTRGKTGAVAAPVNKVDRAKGGGEKWVKMAGAMDEALERMRECWLMVDRLRALHAEGCCVGCGDANWQPLLDEITAVANVLRVGLKAR